MRPCGCWLVGSPPTLFYKKELVASGKRTVSVRRLRALGGVHYVIAHETKQSVDLDPGLLKILNKGD
jgi:hypothetical protein